MDKETYRAALLTVTGGKKDSCSAMSAEELQLALDHFKRFGFKVRLKPRPGRPIDTEATSKKIRALWLLLRDLGAVNNASEEALAAYVKRITGVEALQWIDGAQAERTIETMKKWAMRILPERVRHLVDQVRDRQLEPAVLGKLQAKLNQAFTRNTFDPMLEAFEALQVALNLGSTKP
nr:regulatory protein GemA [Achromobacter sp. Marseille-Q0513]